MNHECFHRTDCDAGTNLQCCGSVQHLKHYEAEFVPPPPPPPHPVNVFGSKTCERHHSRNKDNRQTVNQRNTSFIDQDDGLSLGKQTLCNQRSFQGPNIYSLQPANIVHLDGDAACPNSKVHNFSKDNTPTGAKLNPTFLVPNAQASSVRTNATNVSPHGLFNSVSSSGDYLASQANVPPSKTERNVETSFTASNSNSFGLVITTNLDSDNQNRQVSQFETPFLNIKALGGSIPRVHAKPVVYVDNVPQRRSSSLVTSAPDRTDQQRRYVTELKLDLRRGRAHRMTSNWRSNSSGRASPADGREEIFETDPVPVKAILCRAAPSNCIEDDILTLGTHFEGYVLKPPPPYCEKNHSVFKTSPECDIIRESRTCFTATTEDKLSTRRSNLDYPGAAAVNVKCATPQNSLACLGSLGVTYSAEQLKAKRTPQFNLMEQSQISPSTISSTSTGGLKGRNLSTDSTLPPPTSNTPRWTNTQPETVEINESLNDACFPKFQTTFSRVQREICLDDTSRTSAYTHFHSPTTEKPPSVKTSGDCVSSKTVVSPVAGKTSRGTQSEQFKTVKVVRDVQIQTGPFEDQETQTTGSQASNKACAAHLPVDRVAKTPKSHAHPNETWLKHSPSYTESRQASKPLRRPLIDEIGSVRPGGMSSVDPNKSNTLSRVEHPDSVNVQGNSPKATVAIGAGDHANTNDRRPSHMTETQMINSSRLGDESRTLYQVVRGQPIAEPNQWDNSEVARTTNPQLCQNLLTLTAKGLPTLKCTPAHEEKFGVNTSGLVPSSPDLILNNVTVKSGEQQHTTKPNQDSESVGTREQVTFSIFQNEGVVLVDGLNTPNLCQSSIPQSPNVAVSFKNDPQTVVTLTASTDPQPRKGPCAVTSDECQTSSNPCSCCCQQAECGLSASSSSSGSQSCQCSCCLTPKLDAGNCEFNVTRLPSIPETKIGALMNTRCVGKTVYDGGTRGHTCDIVYDPSREASGQNAYRQKMTSTSSTGSSASCDECSSHCSCCSESCASEKVPEHYSPTRRPNSPFVNNRSYSRQDLHPLVKNDASRTATLNRFILGANETRQQLPKQRNAAQSDERPTYKDHRKPNLVSNKTVAKPSFSTPSKPPERIPSQVPATALQQKSVEQVEQSAGQQVPQNTVKPGSKLDTLFNMVSDKEKRLILQRWLLEQVAYSTKRNQQTQNKNDKAQRKQERSSRTGNVEAGNGSATECTCTKCRNAAERRSLSADSKDTLNCCLDANQNTRCQSNIQHEDQLAPSNRFGRENMKAEVGRNEHCSPSQARISRVQTVFRRSSTETPHRAENDSNIFGRRDRRATSEDPRMSAIGNPIRAPTEHIIARTRASQSADRMAFDDQSLPAIIDPQVAKRTPRGDPGDRVRNLHEIRYSPAGDEDRGLNYGHKSAEKGNTGGRTTNHGVLNDQPTDLRRLPVGLIPPTTRKGGPDANTRPAWNNYAMKPSLEAVQTSLKKDERLNSGPKFGQSRLRASMFAPSNTPTMNVERIFELSQYDDLVKSHLNRADRRIKAVGLKNGCDIRIVGPISTNEQPIAGSGPGRSKVSYHCHIAAPTEEKVWKCVNFLKETFPNSFLRSSWRA